jgi:hypothetical protein
LQNARFEGISDCESTARRAGRGRGHDGLAAIRASQAAERCEPFVARVVSVQGLVEVQPAGAADWVVAALDDRLCFGDTVRVGELGRAALALANDSVLRFDQRTTLRLAGEVEIGRSLLDLLFGEVHFFSHRPRALEATCRPPMPPRRAPSPHPRAA